MRRTRSGPLSRKNINASVRSSSAPPGRPESTASGAGPNIWKDITPRMGAVYDLFGTGKTALRVTLNKYVDGQTGGGATGATFGDPVTNLVTSTTRNWVDANQDFVPDCNFTNPLANGECLAMANANFGTNILRTAYEPKTLQGWGTRGYNWEFSLGAQHEVLPRVSLDVGYFRRIYGNFYATDNLALALSDFTAFSITAPPDSRLPGGGGYLVSGLYNLNPAKFGIPENNYVTPASNYGTQIEHWNGVDIAARTHGSNKCCFEAASARGGRARTAARSWRNCRNSSLVSGLLQPYQGPPRPRPHRRTTATSTRRLSRR